MRETHYIAGTGPYTGELVDGKRKGYGMQRWDNGTLIGYRYEGEWDCDCANGKGRLSSATGSVFEGQWRSNYLHGKASCKLLDGDLFEGEVANGTPCGPGKWTSKEYVVRGEFFRGKLSEDCEIADHFGNVLFNPEQEDLKSRNLQSFKRLLNAPNIKSFVDTVLRGWDWPWNVNISTNVSDEPCCLSTEWISARVSELSNLPTSAILLMCDEMGLETLETTAPRQALEILSNALWEQIPASEQLRIFRRHLNKTEEASKLRAAQIEDDTDASMAALRFDCDQYDRENEADLRTHTSTILRYNKGRPRPAQSLNFDGGCNGEFLLGRASLILADENNSGGISLDLSSAPYKTGDFAFMAKLRYGQPYVRTTVMEPHDLGEKQTFVSTSKEILRYSGHCFMQMSKPTPTEKEYDHENNAPSIRSRSPNFTRSSRTKSGISRFGSTAVTSTRRLSITSAGLKSNIEPSFLRRPSVATGGIGPSNMEPSILRRPSAVSGAFAEQTSQRRPSCTSVSPESSFQQRTSVLFNPSLSSTFQRRTSISPGATGGIERTSSAVTTIRRQAGLLPTIRDTTTANRSKQSRNLSFESMKMNSVHTTRPTAVGFRRASFAAQPPPPPDPTPLEIFAKNYLIGTASESFESLPRTEKLSNLFPSKPMILDTAEQLIMTLGLHENNKMIEFLTALDLSGQLLYELPSRLAIMSNLETLNVSNNHLIKLPEELTQLEKLKVLKLSGNRGLFKTLPYCILKLTWLQELDISNVGLTSLYSTIQQMESLHSLDVSSNDMAELPLLTFCTMTRLTMLECKDNPLIGLRICGIPMEVVQIGGTTALCHSRYGPSWTLVGTLGYLRMARLPRLLQLDDLEEAYILFDELARLSRFFQGKTTLASLILYKGVQTGSFDFEGRAKMLFSMLSQPSANKAIGKVPEVVKIAHFQQLVISTGVTTRGKYLLMIDRAKSTGTVRESNAADKNLGPAEFQYVLMELLKEAVQSSKPEDHEVETTSQRSQKITIREPPNKKKLV